MPRKELLVEIKDDNRDKGKVFFIEEMFAEPAEEWAMRAFFCMARAGIEIPDELAEAGMAGIATIGLKALGSIPFEDAKILMAQMFDCIQIVPDPNRPDVKRRLVPNDIEEVITRLKLRLITFEMHVGFSLRELQSRSKQETAAREPKDIRTSPDLLAH